MFHLHTRRNAVLVLVAVLALAAPWRAAAIPPSDTGAGLATAAHPQALASLWEWLTSLWAEAGCTADPNGCTDGAGGDDPAGSQGDAGCTLDPSGAPCDRR